MPHRVLVDAERTVVLDTFKISNPENQLPWIDSQDTMVKWIGAIPGDVIEVTRHSDTAGRSFYYRYCVEDVNVAQ
jgi:DNA-directed RNA polymerase subunit H (RpoH/RPB5)